MGCGASAGPPEKKPITGGQCTEMCKDACIRMEVLCANAALEKPEAFKIASPKPLADLKRDAASLRAEADKLLEGGKDKDKKEDGGTGGGMMAAAAGLASKAMSKAADAASAPAAKALQAAAGGLDKLTETLEAPLQGVASEVVTKKKEELFNVLVAFINGFAFADPIKICRGEAPWNQENYKAVPANQISETLMSLAAADIKIKLAPTVNAAVDASQALQAWKTATGTYNKAIDAMAYAIDAETLAKGGLKKYDDNVIQNYVVDEIVKTMATLMKEKEAATRADPKDKDIVQPGKPISFAKIFSGDLLFEEDYNTWNTEGVPPAPK